MDARKITSMGNWGELAGSQEASRDSSQVNCLPVENLKKAERNRTENYMVERGNYAIWNPWSGIAVSNALSL
jgi:hypothetical protein